MIFNFINNAPSKIEEYGSSQYSNIIRDNLIDQSNRMRQLYFFMHTAEMSTIIRNLDRKQSREIMHFLNDKYSAIDEVLYMIRNAPIKLIDGELYVVKNRKKHLVFSNKNKQHELLVKLQKTYDRLSRLMLSKVKYQDLLV